MNGQQKSLVTVSCQHQKQMLPNNGGSSDYHTSYCESISFFLCSTWKFLTLMHDQFFYIFFWLYLLVKTGRVKENIIFLMILVDQNMFWKVSGRWTWDSNSIVWGGRINFTWKNCHIIICFGLYCQVIITKKKKMLKCLKSICRKWNQERVFGFILFPILFI